MKRNPVGLKERDEPNYTNKRKLFNVRPENLPKGCVYCWDLGHKATQCEKVTNPADRKEILAKKGLCFNCATRHHRASECTSKTACGHCNKRHHTSICDQVAKSEGNKKLLTDGVTGEGMLPVVVVEVNGVKCRALIDSGAKLIDLINIKPTEITYQRVDMLLSSRTKRLELYDAKIGSVDGSFQMTVRLSKAIFKRGNGKSGNRGIGEPGNRGIGESGNRGIGESGNRGIGESGNRGTGESVNN